jgi:hypothetical protein
MSLVFSAILIAYLPGALTFRLPIAQRDLRAKLAAEERFFWCIMISLAISSMWALSLAAVGWYSWERLLWLNGGLSLCLIAFSRGRLKLGPRAPLPGWTALIPTVLVALSASIIFYVPPAEYLMGGRDPGTYMNEGIQIAQRGTLQISDEVVASVPRQFRDLFFPERLDADAYYSNRFMGFYLMDPDDGSVAGQFSHLYPVWIAIGYGANGLSGARQMAGLWAILGVVAVYFSGAWLVGRRAAAGGALLLALHVSQVWYGRYPNAEIVMQALIFSGLLAFSRSSVENTRFFAPFAAALLCLSIFAHFTGVLAVGAVGATALLGIFQNRRPQLSFLIMLATGSIIALIYFSTVLSPYFVLPINFFQFLRPSQIAFVVLGLTGVVAVLWMARYNWATKIVQDWLPWVVLGSLWSLAAYAYFFREPGYALAVHDAEALRIITEFYLTPLGLIAALVGLSFLVHRFFWSGLAFISTATVFSIFFFYKMRIIPEHFWTARRFIAIILPFAFLMIATTAFSPLSWRLATFNRRAVRMVCAIAGTVVVLLFGYHYALQTAPILTHVEYAGLIPHIERLNTNFEDTDLVLVESRQASDMHVLAVPLAYTYARDTLVLHRARPDNDTFLQFLRWAEGRYRKIFFIGGGGTELVSQSIRVIPITSERFQIPEYEQAYRGYPDAVLAKEFDFGVYELRAEPITSTQFDLDVGTMDDLFVRRFHAKETHGSSGASFRWTRDVSFLSLLGLTAERRTLNVWASSPRPEQLGPTIAWVWVDEHLLGTITATPNFEPYRFTVPLDVASTLETGKDAAQLRIVSNTWNPNRIFNNRDDRDLGMMVDRVTIGK